MHDEGLLIARLFLGIPFIVWGVLKLRGGEASWCRVFKLWDCQTPWLSPI